MDPDERHEPARRPEEAPAWVLAALAVALVMMVPGLALGHGPGRSGPGPDLRPPAAAADPFTVDPCPTRPSASRTGTVVFPQTPLRSIRLCVARGPLSWREPLDALVTDPDALVRSLRDATPAPEACGSDVRPDGGTALQVTTVRGRVATLVGTPCTHVAFYGHDVSFSILDSAVRRAIQAQRHTIRAAPYAPAVSCRQPPTRVDLEPSVERLVRAATCRQHMPYVLTTHQLAAVQQAWSAARSIPSTPAITPCRADPRPQPPPFVLATDFGDTVRPVWDGCRGSWTVRWGTRLVLLPTVASPAL